MVLTMASLCCGKQMSWLGKKQTSHSMVKRGLLGHQGLDIETQHGNHGQSAVLDLLHLQLGKGVWVVSQAQGVEGATRVQAVQILTELTNAATRAVGLHGTHDGQGGQEWEQAAARKWPRPVPRLVSTLWGGGATLQGTTARSILTWGGVELVGPPEEASKKPEMS